MVTRLRQRYPDRQQAVYDCDRIYIVSATVLRQGERPWRIIFGIGIFTAAIAVVAMIVWQGLSAHGAPDPTQPNTSPTVAFLDIGILVFREGLECILVLAAITASMTGAKSRTMRIVAASTEFMSVSVGLGRTWSDLD